MKARQSFLSLLLCGVMLFSLCASRCWRREAGRTGPARYCQTPFCPVRSEAAVSGAGRWTSAAAYYYRDDLPMWKLDGVVKLPGGIPAASAAVTPLRDGKPGQKTDWNPPPETE